MAWTSRLQLSDCYCNNNILDDVLQEHPTRELCVNNIYREAS